MDNIIDQILEFIEDNRPTEVNTDWERGCAYALDEIENLITDSMKIKQIAAGGGNDANT